jgi:hypothetical protein
MEVEKGIRTALRGVPMELHMKIKKEVLAREIAGNPITINDIYLELIEKGKKDFNWSK